MSQCGGQQGDWRGGWYDDPGQMLDCGLGDGGNQGKEAKKEELIPISTSFNQSLCPERWGQVIGCASHLSKGAEEKGRRNRSLKAGGDGECCSIEVTTKHALKYSHSFLKYPYYDLLGAPLPVSLRVSQLLLTCWELGTIPHGILWGLSNKLLC